VHVAWFDSVNGAYDIFVASSTDGGQSFAVPVRVDNDDPGAAYSAYPQIAMGGGVVHVTWEDSRGDGTGTREASDIYYARSDDGGRSFSGELRLDGGEADGQSDSFSPALAVEDDVVYVVWHDARNSVDGSARDVYLNVSRTGGAIWRSEALRADTDDPGAADSQYPVVTVLGGTATVAWADDRFGGFDILSRQHGPDGWLDEAEARLDRGDAQGNDNSIYPAIASGGPGVVVAWEDRRDDQADEGYNDLYYSYGAPDWFDGDLRLDNVESGSKYARELQLALVGERLCAVWIDGRRGNADVYFHGMKVGTEAEYVPRDEVEAP
jgi:hypothetical protein